VRFPIRIEDETVKLRWHIKVRVDLGVPMLSLSCPFVLQPMLVLLNAHRASSLRRTSS